MAFQGLIRRLLPSSLLVAAAISLVQMAGAADLKVGDALPNCSKIPLILIQNEFRPQSWGVTSLEQSMLHDGIVILHFCSPRPPRKGTYESSFVSQLSDLQKAAQSVPYACNPVAVVPFGEKGKDDAAVFLEASETKPWGNVAIHYEPTFPRPGLYRTFHSDASGDSPNSLNTPWTYIIGPDRKIIAERRPDSTVPLYDWLQQNLPDTVIAVPKQPKTNLSVPNPADWVWPTFRKSPQHQLPASQLPDVLPYTYLAWQVRTGRTFSSPVVVDNVVYSNSDSEGMRSLQLSSGQGLAQYSYGGSYWSRYPGYGGYSSGSFCRFFDWSV